MYTNHEIGQT